MTTATPPPGGASPRSAAAIDDAQSLLYWAFVASLVGGLVIAAGAIMSAFMMMAFMAVPLGFAMDGPGVFIAGMILWMVLWGLIMGAVIVVGAFRIRADAQQAKPWGIVIIVAGTLSLFSMGGFMIGAAAAIAGGALALAATRPGVKPADAPDV